MPKLKTSLPKIHKSNLNNILKKEVLGIKKVLVLGSTGMVGHIITRYLISLNKFEITNISRSKLNTNTLIIDIRDKKRLKEAITKIKPDVVINCLGILIKESEEKHDLAIYINSYLPHFLEKLGKKKNFKLIHISTDCVFSGQKGDYIETDFKDGKDYYARTKGLGEIFNERNLTFRTSIIGPELKKAGTGLFHWFMTQTEKVFGYSKTYWTGITTLELAKAINQAIDQDLVSLYHLVPEKKISKYDLLKLIKEIWGKQIDIVKVSKNKSDKSLVNNRKDFKFKVPDYKLMLLELYEWMKNQDYKWY